MARYQHWNDLATTAAKLLQPPVNYSRVFVDRDWTIEPVDPYLSQCLAAHLKMEFPEFSWPHDREAWTSSNIKLRHILRLLSRRRTFIGTCEICDGWNRDYDPPENTAIETQEAVRQFLELKRQDIVETSLGTYANILGTFSHRFPYLPNKPEPIEQYLASKPSFKSRRLIYGILNGLYDLAHKRLGAPQVMKMIVRPPKGKRKEGDYINLEQRRALEGAIRTDRDKALLYLYNDQGFRRSEAIRINVQDIFEDKIRVHGKEGEEWMPLLPEVRAVLLKLASGRSGNEPVFLSLRNKRLGPDMAAEIIGRLFKRAKITGVRASPHTLRHGFATLMQAAGCDRYSVELLMRHRTENTTDIYSHLSIEQRLQLLRPKLERYAPIRLLNGNKPNIPINSGLARCQGLAIYCPASPRHFESQALSSWLFGERGLTPQAPRR